jgi:hypothetical protein
MLKKLLYLYNDGHNPFPHLKGKGGLGYHLPQYRMKGGMFGRGGSDDEDEYEPYEEPFVEESGNKLLSDEDIQAEEYPPLDSYSYEIWLEGENGQEFLKLSGLSKPKKVELEPEDTPLQTIMAQLEDVDEPLEKLEIIFHNLNDNELDILKNKYFNKNDTFFKGQAISSTLKTIDKDENPAYYLFYDVLYRNGIVKSKNFKNDPEKVQEFKLAVGTFLDSYRQQKEDESDLLKISGKKKNKEKIYFEVPQESEVDPEMLDLDYVREIILKYSNDDNYKITIEKINKVDMDNPYETLYGNKYITSQTEKGFLSAFTVPRPVLDLTVIVDGKVHKGKGGVDFELKTENNIPFIESVVNNIFNTNLISIEPQTKENYGKIDIYANTGDGVKNIELKKYTNYDSEMINERTESAFNNWFYEYKTELSKAYIRSGIDNFALYNNLLSKITTKGKLDPTKLLDEHVNSGKYYGLPLTLSKARSPTPEEIKERYKDLSKEEHKKMEKYFKDKRRRNEMEADLAPVFLIKDAVLSDHAYKSFKGQTPFTKLKLMPNAYGSKLKMQSALCYPACYLKNIPITKEMLRIGNEDLTLSKLRQIKKQKYTELGDVEESDEE